VIPVTDIIDGTLVALGDPSARRHDRPVMLRYYNEVQLEVASTLQCLEVDSDFDIVAGNQNYAYPDDMVVLRELQFTLTPQSPDTHRTLDEIFRDERRRATYLRWPTGWVWGYYARQSFFQLVGKPSVDIMDGGLITYARTPAWVATETGTFLELPDFTRIFVQRGMEIFSRLTDRERAVAQQDLERWRTELAALKTKITDRSDDRRAALRPASGRSLMMGQR
jgi:hypothetical protein